MNRIKANFILSLILLVLLSTIFFITSCSDKDETPTPQPQQSIEKTINPQDASSGSFITLPSGFENNSEKQNQTYLENLSDSEIAELQENFKISDYLNSIGKDEDIGNLLKTGETFLDIDLSQHLSEDQLAELSNYNYEAATEDARGCWHWRYSFCWGNGKVYRDWFYCYFYWGVRYWYSPYGC